jgi:DNA-binding beta-propeller fold protein YncE
VGLAFDASGNIYVSDVGNNRIQKFDSHGNYLSQFGSYGSGNGQFFAPYGVAVGK